MEKIFTDEEIEKMLAVLSSPEEKRVARLRLKAKNNFSTISTNTYHELAVGYQLWKLGYQIKYDKDIKGLTPDWYVYPKGKIPEFIVEVFTTTSGREKRSEEDRQIKDLEERLGKIAFDATLKIRLDDITSDYSGYNKRITREIEEWLKQKEPLVGTKYVGNRFSCEVVKRDTGISNVNKLNVIFVQKFLLVDTNYLLKIIKEKVRKYKNLEMPLVVAVVTDASLGEELKSILVGGIHLDYDYNETTGVEDSKVSLLKDGLFNKKPELSAVILVDRLWNGWKISGIYNPTAEKPLPYDTFGEKECPIYY